MDGSSLQVSLNHDAFDLRTMKMKLNSMKLNSTLLACSWKKARSSYLNLIIHSSSRYTFIRTKNIEWSRLAEKNTKLFGPTKWTRINPLVHQMNQIKLHSFPGGPVSVLGASKFPEETLSYRSNQSLISSYDVLSLTFTFRLQQEFQFLCSYACWTMPRAGQLMPSADQHGASEQTSIKLKSMSQLYPIWLAN